MQNIKKVNSNSVKRLQRKRFPFQFIKRFIKLKSKILKVRRSKRPSKWFWTWRFNTWIRLKKTRFMRRQRGNKRFNLFQQYAFRVHLKRFSRYDPRRSFIFIFTLRRPPMTRKECRFSNIMLRRYLSVWYNIKSLGILKILYKKFLNSYYLYFSFLHFLNYKLDSVLSITRLAFNLPRAWDLIKLRVIFVNNCVAKSNNIILQSGDFISLSWLFFYCFRIPRKTYIFIARNRPKAFSFLLFNYRIFSLIFLGLPARYLLGRFFNYSSLYKSSRALPWFKQRYFARFGRRGNFMYF